MRYLACAGCTLCGPDAGLASLLFLPLNLGLEALDLPAQVGDDARVLRDVVGHGQQIALDLVGPHTYQGQSERECERVCAGERECMWVGGQLTLVLMLLALSAYSRVVRDSSKDVLAGLMWAIITVRLFPPRASCSEGGRAGGGNRPSHLPRGALHPRRALLDQPV